MNQFINAYSIFYWHLYKNEYCGRKEDEDSQSRNKKEDGCDKDALPLIVIFLFILSAFVQVQKHVAEVVASRSEEHYAYRDPDESVKNAKYFPPIAFWTERI
jgi:hypothetical protein